MSTFGAVSITLSLLFVAGIMIYNTSLKHILKDYNTSKKIERITKMKLLFEEMGYEVLPFSVKDIQEERISIKSDGIRPVRILNVEGFVDVIRDYAHINRFTENGGTGLAEYRKIYLRWLAKKASENGFKNLLMNSNNMSLDVEYLNVQYTISYPKDLDNIKRLTRNTEIK